MKVVDAMAVDPVQRVTIVTAYDATTAALVEESSVDLVLVGDSLGVTMVGYDSPDQITAGEMVRHTAAVARAVDEKVVIADIPLGVDPATPERTVRTANRLWNEAGNDTVKLKARATVDPIPSIDASGIPAVGHLGTAARTDHERRSETPPPWSTPPKPSIGLGQSASSSKASPGRRPQRSPMPSTGPARGRSRAIL
jgi:hypothetical protein